VWTTHPFQKRSKKINIFNTSIKRTYQQVYQISKQRRNNGGMTYPQEVTCCIHFLLLYKHKTYKNSEIVGEPLHSRHLCSLGAINRAPTLFSPPMWSVLHRRGGREPKTDSQGKKSLEWRGFSVAPPSEGLSHVVQESSALPSQGRMGNRFRTA